MAAPMRLLTSGKCRQILMSEYKEFSRMVPSRSFNAHRTSIARIGRATYVRLYPTLLVQPDGSTYTIRYHVPQKIITLPVDITTLTEEEKLIHLTKRRPKQAVVIQEEVEDNFNVDEYSHLWKK